jgi:hypothetical protein
LTSNVFDVGLSSVSEFNLMKELGSLGIYPFAGLGCVDLALTVLWQLYARGNARAENGGWIATRDGGGSRVVGPGETSNVEYGDD